MRKSEDGEHKLIVIEEECPRVPRRGWAEMIRKVYEVDSLLCIFFMILSLPRGRGLDDLRLFWRLERLQERIAALSSCP